MAFNSLIWTTNFNDYFTQITVQQQQRPQDPPIFADQQTMRNINFITIFCCRSACWQSGCWSGGITANARAKERIRMRMNRGTIILIAALLVIIVVVLVVEQSTGERAWPTRLPLEDRDRARCCPASLARTSCATKCAIIRHGDFIALTKDSGGAWHIDATNALAGRDPDQSLINTTVGQIATINYNNTFHG